VPSELRTRIDSSNVLIKSWQNLAECDDFFGGRKRAGSARGRERKEWIGRCFARTAPWTSPTSCLKYEIIVVWDNVAVNTLLITYFLVDRRRILLWHSLNLVMKMDKKKYQLRRAENITKKVSKSSWHAW